MSTITTPLTRFRGDNYPLTIRFRNATDITGFVVTFSVCRTENPVAPVEYVLQSTATIDNANKKATFSFTTAQVDLLGSYYYDIEVENNGVFYTVAKGRITFTQDITK